MLLLRAQGKTHAEIAQITGYTRSYVSTMLGKLAEQPHLLEGMSRGGRKPGSLRALSVKEERRARFMKAQEKISARKLKAKVGRTLKVLVDAPGVGRSAADAPEIDGTVRFEGGKAGDFADVLVERAGRHDLYGRRL